MGDDEARPPEHQLVHRALDEDLGARVDRARGLVEDEDPPVGEERPGDRQELLLALRHARRVVVEDGVVAVGQRPHEVVDVGGLRGGDRSPPRSRPRGRRRCSRGSCRGTATCPGGPSRTSSAARRATSRGCRCRRSRMWPAVDLVEAHQQVHEGRLAGPGRPDDGDRLAGLDDEVQVVDERRVGQVAERHALELDLAPDRPAGSRRPPCPGPPRARRAARRRVRRRRRRTG